ncbi:MAG TPA: TIGR03564 family F420-dependent LLM class oxidoreductase [Chloroflexota bacterium]
MRFGVMVDASAPGGGSASVDQLVGQVAARANDGLSSAWFANVFGVDALTIVAVTGRAVPSIELGTAVMPVYTRHPMAMAQQALTAQAAIGNRLTLGIGLAHQIVVEQRWGMPWERPAEYMREYLAVLQPLLRGEAVGIRGERLSGEGQLTIPGAMPPPVLLAALGPRMLRLAGEQADGTLTWMAGPKTIANHIAPNLNEAASAAGRPQPRIVVGLPLCVTDDVDGARHRATRIYERYGQLPSYRAMLDREGAAGPADIAIVGSESEVEHQLNALERAGATDLCASVFGSAEQKERGYSLLRTLVAHGRGTPV